MGRLKKVFFFGLSIVFVTGIFDSAAYSQKKKPLAKKVVAKKPATPPLNLPKVIQIDQAGLTQLLRREGENAKPLLINFWATWCDPCREEFPELVKLDIDYKGKIDFITISLDDLAEINRGVPKFLASMKATMPAYLLKTPDEEAAIVSVAKDWQGGLPFTILFDSTGKQAYFRQGKVIDDVLRKELGKLFVQAIIQPKEKLIENVPSESQLTKTVSVKSYYEFPPSTTVFTAERGKQDAQRDIAQGILRIQLTGLIVPPSEKAQKNLDRYGINIQSFGCMTVTGQAAYAIAYNELMLIEIMRRFGKEPFIQEYFPEINNLNKKPAPIQEVKKIAFNSENKVLDVSQPNDLSLFSPPNKGAKEGESEAKADISNGILHIKRYGLTAAIPEAQLKKIKKRYGIEVSEYGCMLVGVTPEYFAAYNNVMAQEIKKKFGEKALKELPL